MALLSRNVRGISALLVAGLVLLSHHPAIAGDPPGVSDTASPAQGTWHTGHFDISYGREAGANVGEYVLWLENARTRASQILHYLPFQPVPVTICATEAEYRTARGTGDPHEGSVVGRTLVLLPDTTHPARTAAVLTRLYLRGAIREMAGGHAAPWLQEGMEGFLSDGFTPSLGVLAPAVLARKLTPLGPGRAEEASSRLDPEPVGGDPPASDAAASLSRAESVFAVYYLAQTAGGQSMPRLLLALGKGLDWAAALKEAAGMGPSQFEDGWMSLARTGVRDFVPPGMITGRWSTPHRLVLGAPHSPQAGHPAHIRIAVGDTSLGLTDNVDALLVAGGSVTIQGTVTSRIGVLGGNVHLLPTARVGGQITILGGTLKVDQGAVVDASADVSGNGWDPTAIRSDRANLSVDLQQPIHIDLRLPGQSYLMQEGSLTVPAKGIVDAATSIGGPLVVEGSVAARAVAIGGDVRLSAAPASGWIGASAGGQVLLNGDVYRPKAASPEDADNPPPTATSLPHFQENFTAPAQAGPDPVPVYLGVGDSVVATNQSYDAILCVGGNCLVSGAARGGLLIGGDLAGLKGATLTGPFWVFGGHVHTQDGVHDKGLEVKGDAGPA